MVDASLSEALGAAVKAVHSGGAAQCRRV